MKSHCEQHGIRTDVSTPSTPEQNGASESANKVVLRLARSMLKDAKMPPIYWPWAVDHACFIVNRLFCLRTKQIPLIDFMQGLNQVHTGMVDFRNIPRFGCRAYILITPKPGKFELRATKGWFIGFQKNKNKIFIIYHPHYASAQGWKWTESFTPHATFNEDVIIGEELPSPQLNNIHKAIGLTTIPYLVRNLLAPKKAVHYRPKISKLQSCLRGRIYHQRQ